MNTENPNLYIIKYSNYLEYAGRVLAFRKQNLFDITNTPILIHYNESAKAWIINQKHLSKKKASEIIIMKDKIKDVSNLQWYKQLELDYCFNL